MNSSDLIPISLEVRPYCTNRRFVSAEFRESLAALRPRVFPAEVPETARGARPRDDSGRLFPLTGGGFETEGVEGDEAGSVVLVIGFFLTAFHGGDGFGIHAEGASAAGLHDVSFI